MNTKGDVKKVLPHGVVEGTSKPDIIPLRVNSDGDLLLSDSVEHSLTVSDTGSQIMLEAADFDGSALPNSVSEGDAVRAKGTMSGIQFAFLVNENGSKTAVGVDNAVAESAPSFLKAGGVYNSATQTYANGDDVIDQHDVNGYKRVVNRCYDSSNNADQIIVLNGPENQQSGSTLAAITNGADATYYYYIDMSNYSMLGIQAIISGGSGTVTLTVEGTMQDDGTAAASCTYNDITNTLYGAASFTASAALIDSNRVGGLFKYIRIKIVASTGGANDGDWTLYHKKIYA